MKKYIDKDGRRTIEVDDLSFLSDREHPYNWFQRHYHHHTLRIALKKADVVIARDPDVATDLVRYYFVPKDKIVIRLLPSHKPQSGDTDADARREDCPQSRKAGQ